MTLNNKQAYSVLVPLNINNSNCQFDYLSNKNLTVGSTVEINFGKKGKVWGVIKFKKKIDPKIRYKEIVSVNKNIFLCKKTLDFIDRVSEWTMSSPGSILKLMFSDKDLFNNEQINNQVPQNYDLKQFFSHKNKIKLTKDQNIAAKKILNLIKCNDFISILLDGVTGSGKTEVYFEAIRNQIKLNKSSLILLPEIFLSQEWKKRFEEYFGFEAIEWHSQLSKKQRRENWFNVYKNNPKVVVGARSALFLPIKELGLIIIDEEHDHSYKQEDIVRYHARDMALYKAKLFQIPIILSTATPSIETWNNAKNKKFNSVKLKRRIGKGNLPKIELIDMRKTKLKSGYWISKILLDQIISNKKKNQLSLLFLNRRGYAPIKLCNNCGEKIGCSNCQSWLVEHKGLNKLLCHQCGFSKIIPTKCPHCKNDNTLISFGPGVERIAEEVKLHFPKLKIAILSSDTIKTTKTFSEIIKRITNKKIELIIGTQIISKGYNFKNLTLVGIIDADLGLKGGDLRASEKTFQLLHQVAGRAGRENIQGSAYIQTYNPDNLVIKSLQNYDRNKFLSIETISRKSLNMPPFGKLASIILSSKNETLLKKISMDLLKSYHSYKDVELYGPAPSQIYVIRGNFRIRFLIKSTKNINIQKVIKFWLDSFKLPSSIKLHIDIDPYTFL